MTDEMKLMNVSALAQRFEELEVQITRAAAERDTIAVMLTERFKPHVNGHAAVPVPVEKEDVPANDKAKAGRPRKEETDGTGPKLLGLKDTVLDILSEAEPGLGISPIFISDTVYNRIKKGMVKTKIHHDEEIVRARLNTVLSELNTWKFIRREKDDSGIHYHIMQKGRDKLAKAK